MIDAPNSSYRNFAHPIELVSQCHPAAGMGGCCSDHWRDRHSRNGPPSNCTQPAAAAPAHRAGMKKHTTKTGFFHLVKRDDAWKNIANRYTAK